MGPIFWALIFGNFRTPYRDSNRIWHMDPFLWFLWYLKVGFWNANYRVPANIAYVGRLAQEFSSGENLQACILLEHPPCWRHSGILIKCTTFIVNSDVGGTSLRLAASNNQGLFCLGCVILVRSVLALVFQGFLGQNLAGLRLVSDMVGVLCFSKLLTSLRMQTKQFASTSLALLHVVPKALYRADPRPVLDSQEAGLDYKSGNQSVVSVASRTHACDPPPLESADQGQEALSLIWISHRRHVCHDGCTKAVLKSETCKARRLCPQNTFQESRGSGVRTFTTQRTGMPFWGVSSASQKGILQLIEPLACRRATPNIGS